MNNKIARKIRKELNKVIKLHPERAKNYNFYYRQAKKMYQEGLWCPLENSA